MNCTDRPVDLEQHLITELHQNVLSLLDDGKPDQAANMASQLLLEPALDRYREAGLHSFLACSDQDPVEHGKKAVSLYKTMLREEGLNGINRDKLQLLREEATNRLKEARLAEKNRKRRKYRELKAAQKEMDAKE